MATLTILTDPAPCGRFFLSERSKRIIRPLKRLIKPIPISMRSKYRGHSAVTRSLVEGLQKISVPYIYDPQSLSDVTDNVIVLSNVNALRQAVMWKRQGRIHRLLAGPNIVVFPSECKELSAPEVDLCITPSDWTCKAYIEDCPDLQDRCVAWPAGVDTSYWKPNGAATNSRKVLLFEKHAAGTIPSLSDYIKVLSRRGYKISLIKSGGYMREEYYSALQLSSLMVGFSRSESQGIAWAEAWSMDVPTLLWRNDMNTIKGKKVRVSTAPYLSCETGSFFDGPADFEQLLKEWEQGRHEYRPRQWVLQNMSDEGCAMRLCTLIGIYQSEFVSSCCSM
jgi:hypothetical protein